MGKSGYFMQFSSAIDNNTDDQPGFSWMNPGDKVCGNLSGKH